MKISPVFPAIVCFASLFLRASATTFYVDQNSSTPTAPFSAWNTAATNIQDAIDASVNGDQILVTNGVYQYGGRVMAGNLTNRVALNKPVTVQSVNGPFVTFIQGAGATNGAAAVRCAWLTNGAALVGFTLQGGATRNSGDATTLENGGGVWCASSNAIVSNCAIKTNAAYNFGGGAYQGTLKNCLLTGNSSQLSDGGGAASVLMLSCTVAGNTGNGVYASTFTNCIVYGNSSSDHPAAGPFAYSCTTALISGPGNINAAPQWFADGVHLAAGSPCIGAGTNLVTGTDIFGRPWANPPSMGCAEWSPAPLVAAPQIQLTGDPTGFIVGNVAFTGQPPFFYSWLKDGVPLSDDAHFSGTQTTNLVAVGVSFADAGNYQLVVSNAFGVTTGLVARLVIHCVDVAGASPVAPYTNWTTAATNIQDAINAAAGGEIVLVTNGVYTGGYKSMDGVITNCVAVNKALLVHSVNGPNATIIHGIWDPISTNGPGAVRCAWLTNNAVLSGFTLLGGATRIGTTISYTIGGGVYGAGTNQMVYNCVIATNFAANSGGGAYKANLSHCTLIGNYAVGSGIPGTSGSAGQGSGGGALQCNLKNCLVTANVAEAQGGGGTESCNSTNCAYTKNASFYNGSAVDGGVLINCTITGNTSSSMLYSGSAVYGASLFNCIVRGNFERVNYSNTNYGNCTMSYCCADPLPAGTGNLSVDPQFLADGIHVASTSPCLGGGASNLVSGADFDGQPWNNPPAIGCDEFNPALLIVAQPVVQINFSAHSLAFNMVAAGQPPFGYFWSKNGVPIQNDTRHGNSGTANLVVNNFGQDDAGAYQVMVTNAFGIATSQVAQVVIHCVDAAGGNPVAPYSSWATAATNIQDAIDAALAGEIVLVTNGVYATGGKVEAGTLTNRVVLDKALTLISVNGWAQTIIQGQWDPISTNGPGAVRCAYVGDGSSLSGFTLRNGATRGTGDASAGGPLESGGGVWCVSVNGTVANCVLTNNCAVYGGGFANGTLNNSLVIQNLAAIYGGGVCNGNLVNCTVIYNNILYAFANGAGTYGGGITNSIVFYNYYRYPAGLGIFPDNYSSPSGAAGAKYFYSCTPAPLGFSSHNTNASPQFLDAFHIAVTSPCRGKGTPLAASGCDLDGEVWTNPPSMGCDEIIPANLAGPLSATIISYQSNVLAGHFAGFAGQYSGRVSSQFWNYGDGVISSNSSATSHMWASPGDYNVTYTVYNNDNPDGVSVGSILHVLPLVAPLLQSTALQTNGFQFQFPGQTNAAYVIQYTTNLVPPVTWSTLKNIFQSTEGLQQITDSNAPTGTRFYRVQGPIKRVAAIRTFLPGFPKDRPG